MFERIKCYRNLKKTDKFLLGYRKIGEISQDEKIIREANEILYKNAVIKKKMWHDRELAVRYNLEYIRNGFHK